ncbi:PREDICTED: suppressor protein MPT5-like [Ipomoea nil]|uniref:suppressor protein MPT5-like n=1 Tax=Ipomoea nil TaxID=35883 RepID=UPI0009011FC7|nr:PREDICTED: suppressor protein MPT5-like [Ipomoea nil]
MYGAKGKGSVKNQYVDGSDYVNGVIMGVKNPSRSLTSGYGLWGDGSSSSSFLPFDHSVNQALNARSGVSGLLNGYNEQNLEGLVERGLCDDLYRMHIGKGAGEYGGCGNGRLGSNESGVGFEEAWMNGTVGSNLNCNIGNLKGSESVSLASHKYSFDSVRPFCSDSQKERMDHLLEMSKWQKRPSFGDGEGFFSPGHHGNGDGGAGNNVLSHFQRFELVNRGLGLNHPCFKNGANGDEGFWASQYPVIDDGGVGDNKLLSPFLGSQLMKHRQGWNSGYDCSTPVLNQRPRGLPNGMVDPPPSFLPNSRDCETVGSKQNFISLEEALKCYANENLNCLKAQKMNEVSMPRFREKNLKTYNEECQHGGFCEVDLRHSSHGISVTSPIHLQPVHNSLGSVQDYICKIAKDQLGCRALQRAFDQGTLQDVQLIFDGIIDQIGEFMVDQFGNYLVQKLLNFCNDEQRMQIVLRVTREPGQLVRISLDSHGTRAVQKLIETMKTRQEISLVIQALEPGFLDLATDLNGNHVLQRFLQSLSKEHNKFIMNAAAKYCFEIATHRYGCCVLNKCISYASGKHREKLLACTSFHALILAQDAFGNYVIQYIIELKNHSIASVLLSQFEGHFVHLSKQKFSSHVVEKCLKFIEESRAIIIHELISVPQFEQLLQDPFANYVIQSALGVAKGPLRALLVDAVRPHMALLRSNPFCKKILSQSILKKK